jgi:hypothetical protein
VEKRKGETEEERRGKTAKYGVEKPQKYGVEKPRSTARKTAKYGVEKPQKYGVEKPQKYGGSPVRLPPPRGVELANLTWIDAEKVLSANSTSIPARRTCASRPRAMSSWTSCRTWRPMGRGGSMC